MKNFTFLLISFLLISCAKEDKSSSTSTPDAVADIAFAKSTVESLGIFTESTDSFALMSNTVWQGDASWGSKNIYSVDGKCVDEDSPKAYMDNSLNSGCANSNFWDLMGLFKLSCAAMYTVPSPGGLPDVTARTNVKLTSRIKALCDLPSEFNPELEVAVGTTTNTSVYQRLVIIYMDGTEVYHYWIGKDGSKTNMQFKDFELGTAKFVGFYTYDSTSSVTLFELQGRHDEGAATAFFLRFHQNASTKVATALGSMGDLGAGNFQRWSFQGRAGNTNASNPISVNLQWDNNGDTGNLSTCVNSQTQVASGTTIACGTYQAPAAIGTINTFLSTTTNTLRGINNATLLAKPIETTTISFTPANIHSVAIQ